ncbi:MAG: PD-(D/E)XK nuclease family protein [Bacteroidota bacterium]
MSLASEEFSQALGHLLDELFDERIPFRQTDHLKSCEHCVYREICLR